MLESLNTAFLSFELVIGHTKKSYAAPWDFVYHSLKYVALRWCPFLTSSRAIRHLTELIALVTWDFTQIKRLIEQPIEKQLKVDKVKMYGKWRYRSLHS